MLFRSRLPTPKEADELLTTYEENKIKPTKYSYDEDKQCFILSKGNAEEIYLKKIPNKKPTQYWFINCKPKNNLVFEPLEYVEQRIIATVKGTDCTSRKTERSMIHPQYADRFIRQYILDEAIWRKE